MRKPKENKNCPYCLSPVGADEDKVRCPKCGVVHHADCWRTNGSCSVYGCDGWALWSSEITERLAPEAEEQVEVSSAAATKAAVREKVRCINCGREIKPGRLLCGRCGRSGLAYRFDNCFGPSVILVCGVTGIITLIVRALT